MPRDLILGTAGHIDHGKTTLVKALTGIDCDRLPEEKARGITIDIGFAHLQVGDVRLGVVDVPGHERFIKNMLAGATGIDLALLVVAADDSVMPQTREHFEILKLLGVRHGVVALTKADLVDETTRQVVALEVRELLAGSPLADAPVVATSAVTGLGIERLKQELALAAARIDRAAGADDGDFFRLPIDRAFVVHGHGTVVTGSVASGSVRVGDELDWHRGDGTVETIRVRGITNHGRPVEEAHRGQRAGLNLAGVPHEAVRRGQELCSPGYLAPSRVLTVHLHAPARFRQAIKHRLPVRFHAGTTESLGTIALLDRDRLEPGQWGLAQVFLERPVTTVWGQGFVVRDCSAEHTLGGGRVLQPGASKLRRRHTDALERLVGLLSEDAVRRLLSAVWFATYQGIGQSELVRGTGIAPGRLPGLIEASLGDGRLVEFTTAGGRKVLLHGSRVAELEARILDTLAALHSENPLATTHDRQRVLARLDFVRDEALLQAVTDRLLARRCLVGDSRRLALADFRPRLTANQRKLKDRIVEAHSRAGFSPPDPQEFVNLVGGNAGAIREIYEVAVAEGLLVKINDGLYLDAATEAALRARVSERLRTGPGLTVAEIRDLLGTTRKYAVPLCEYLDRIGLTTRVGDLRVLAGT
jgi:selenocysteine-specific elongation factor